MILLALPIFVVGILLLVIGLRGVATDDHPLCQKCGFDLTGKPRDSHFCAECGSDLRQATSIRIGHRKRRKGLLITGLLTMLFFGLLLTAGITDALSGINWIEHEPTFWLAHQTKSSAAATRDLALNELTRRLVAGALSDATIASVADSGLQYQADLRKTWVPGWGDFVEAAESAGKLSDDRWKKYLSNAVNFTLVVRPRIRRSDWIPYSLREGACRVGSRMQLWCDLKSQSWTFDGIKQDRGGGMGFGLSIGGGGAVGSSLSLNPKIKRLADGLHYVALTEAATISPSTSFRPKNPPSVTMTLNFSAPVTLIPQSQPTVTINRDRSLRAAVEKAISIPQGITRQKPPSTHVETQIQIMNLPFGIGYDVYAQESGGRQFELGSFAAVAGTYNAGWGFQGDAAGLSAGQVDVILRPSTKAAEATVNVFSIWDGEIVIKNVKVH